MPRFSINPCGDVNGLVYAIEDAFKAIPDIYFDKKDTDKAVKLKDALNAFAPHML